MGKILIVEDAAFMRMMIKDTLYKLGYTDVEEADDGLDAVEKYRELLPDLVLLDIVMPNLDGIAALKSIMEINPDAKVIICSAMGQETMVVDAIKHGVSDYIVKPFKPARIAKAIKAIHV